MNTYIRLMAGGVGAVALGAALETKAAVATWDFSNGTTLPIEASAQSGLSSASLSTSGGSITPTISSGVLQFKFTGAASSLNGSAITLTMVANSAATFNSLTYTFAQSSSINALNGTWDYSITGTRTASGTYGTSSIFGDGTKSQTLTGVNLSSGDTLNLRLTISGAQGNGSVISFDNINVSAVPEPANTALAGFGLVVTGVGTARWLVARRKSKE